MNQILSSRNSLYEKFPEEIRNELSQLSNIYLIQDIIGSHFEPKWKEDDSWKETQITKFAEVFYSETGHLPKFLDMKKYFQISPLLVVLAKEAFKHHITKTVSSWEGHKNSPSILMK